MKTSIDYSKDSGKMGRYNLSFRTGVHERKHKNSKRERRNWSREKRTYV